jgi:V-type H+-transporting ATPase subunit C
MSDAKLEGKLYWLVSAPKTNEDTFNTLNKKTTDEQDLSLNYKFQVPDLKVGTLDSLMALSDDLVKIDSHVENIVRKISGQLFDVLEAKADKYESLSVNNSMYFSTICSNFRKITLTHTLHTSDGMKPNTQQIHP